MVHSCTSLRGIVATGEVGSQVKLLPSTLMLPPDIPISFWLDEGTDPSRPERAGGRTIVYVLSSGTPVEPGPDEVIVANAFLPILTLMTSPGLLQRTAKSARLDPDRKKEFAEAPGVDAHTPSLATLRMSQSEPWKIFSSKSMSVPDPL